MKLETDIRAELLRRRRLLAHTPASVQPHMAIVDNQSAVLVLQWVLDGAFQPTWETFGENSLGWIWWKLGLNRLFPGFRVGAKP